MRNARGLVIGRDWKLRTRVEPSVIYGCKEKLLSFLPTHLV